MIVWPRLRYHLRNIALALVALCFGAFIFERYITYQVVRSTKSPEAAGLHGIVRETLTTQDGETIVVWLLDAKPGQPTLLYFHGNGEPLDYRAERIRLFQAVGWGVYMMAYRGYSGSSGRPSERAIVDDAHLAFDRLRARGVDPSDIFIYGESLGASIAVQTAINRPARAVILEAPFTSMVATWRQFVPFLPVGLLLRDRYETIKVIHRLEAALLVIHGERDRLVRPWQGRALFDTARAPKRFAALPDAAHMNLFAFGAMDIVHRFVADVRAGAAIE